MSSKSVDAELSRLLVDSAFTTADIDKWIDSVASQIGGVTWRHVGWSNEDPNISNAGTCEVANDKRAPVAELFFNAVDAVIDLAHRVTGMTASSPHSFVSACPLFDNGPSTWSRNRIRFTLHDSEQEDRPTLDVRDLGHGQHPDDFRDTFLSLHSSSKLSSPHLCGKFGMGLKSSFKFCSRLVIVSRPHDAMLRDRESQVGVSVVRKKYTKGNKTAHYEYLCDAFGRIIRLDIDESLFGHGTLVRMAAYRLEGYTGGISKLHNSMRLMLNSYAIDPPIQATVSDRRGDSKENMTLRGMLYTLENPKTPNSHEDSFTVNVDFEGTVSRVGVRYFVLHPKESPHDKTGTKVKAEQGITFSHNGQRHGVEPRSLFTTRFGLGAIYKRLVVIVDTSGLDPAACSDLYSSNRIEVDKQSKVYEAVMDALHAHMNDDEDLQSLDEEATKKKRDDQAAQTESIEKAVSAIAAEIIGRKQIVGVRGSVGVANGGGNRGRRNRDDSHLNPLPTRVVVNNDPFVVPCGRFGYLTLDIDAKNGYVEPGDGKISVTFAEPLARVRSEGRLIGGKMRLIVEVPETCDKAESEFEVKLEDKANNIHLSAKGTMKVVEPRKGKEGVGNKKTGGGSGSLAAPTTSFQWIFREDWDTEQWNSEFPGECFPRFRDGVVEHIAFHVNADLGVIEAMKSKLPKNKTRAFGRRLEEYGKVICRALLHQKIQSMESDTSYATAIAESMFGDVPLESDDDSVERDEEVSISASKVAGAVGPRPSPEREERISIPAAKSGILASPTFAAEMQAATNFKS